MSGIDQVPVRPAPDATRHHMSATPTIQVKLPSLRDDVSAYSVENAVRFNWHSVSGNLHQERVGLLKANILGTKILDAGCGGGAYVNFLAQSGFDVTGVDKHPQFLSIAAAKKY